MGSAILLTALVALVASRDSTHPLRLVVTSGMLFGLLIVTIPTLAFVVALVAVWLALLKARRQAVVVILTALLLPAAWTGRNAAVMHTLAPVSTNGGLNLLLGNSPVTGPRSGVTADLSPYYRYAKAHHLGEVASDAYFRSSALHWIGAHPASAAVLYLEKTANYFAPFDRLATASESSPGQDILASIVYLPLLVIRIGRWRRDPPGSAEVLLLSIYLLCAPRAGGVLHPGSLPVPGRPASGRDRQRGGEPLPGPRGTRATGRPSRPRGMTAGRPRGAGHHGNVVGWASSKVRPGACHRTGGTRAEGTTVTEPWCPGMSKRTVTSRDCP